MKTINLNEESILRAQAIGTLRIVPAVTAFGERIQIEDEMGLIEYADSVSAAERRIACLDAFDETPCELLEDRSGSVQAIDRCHDCSRKLS